MSMSESLSDHLNVSLTVAICVILGAILDRVDYTDAVYPDDFERIYRSFL